MSKLDMILLGTDDLAEPRLIELDRSTRLLHLEALAWAARYRTDGFISRASLRRLTDAEDAALAAATLVSAGLWASTPDGWQLPWADQLTAEEANRLEANNRQRWARQKERQRKHTAGDHSLCRKPHCPHADARADNSAVPPPFLSDRTVSTFPKGKRREEGADGPEAPVTPSMNTERARAILEDAEASEESRAGATAYLQLSESYGNGTRPGITNYRRPIEVGPDQVLGGVSK